MQTNSPAQATFLSLDEVLEIHATIAGQYGLSNDVRDYGLLESALFRPKTGYYTDLHEMAAALWESILMHRPFKDGNKRTAFFIADVFLRVNGFRIRTEPDKAHRRITGIAQHGSDVQEALTTFLRRTCTPLRQ